MKPQHSEILRQRGFRKVALSQYGGTIETDLNGCAWWLNYAANISKAPRFTSPSMTAFANWQGQCELRRLVVLLQGIPMMDEIDPADPCFWRLSLILEGTPFEITHDFVVKADINTPFSSPLRANPSYCKQGGALPICGLINFVLHFKPEQLKALRAGKPLFVMVERSQWKDAA